MRVRVARRSKFGNKPTIVSGYRFDSKAEARRYTALKLMQMAGAIDRLRVHPIYVLQDSFRVKGKLIKAITYEPDFAYLDNEKHGCEVAEDVKGVRTEVFRIKEKLFRKLYPTIDFRIINVR